MLTLSQVWGALLIFILCPLAGVLPLTKIVVNSFSAGRSPAIAAEKLGVAAAFEAGGAIAGSLAVGLEAAKGMAAVFLARHYFPADPGWEVVALIALVMGRYWTSQTVGTTSVMWGALVHRPVVAGLTLLISFLGFTIFREKQQGRLLVLVLFPVILALSGTSGMHLLLTACWCGLIGWIYHKVPEEWEVPSATRLESRRLFGFFRSDRALLSLDKSLDAAQVGSKAARLSQLLAGGYPVPPGYVLPAGDDPAMLLEITRPSVQSPVVVRPSVVGDAPAIAASAGQYTAITQITSQEALYAAMNQCFRSYDRASAVQYRRDRDLSEGSLAVIVQQQVTGLCSGVAASRDPLTCQGDSVVVEALLGEPALITTGRQMPERFQVVVQADDISEDIHDPNSWQLPAALTLTVRGTGETPQRLVQEVAYLARHVETRSRGIPQVIEWSFDGDRLWLLQSRPMIPPLSGEAATTALPAAEAPEAVPPPPERGALIGLGVSPGPATGTLWVLKALKDMRVLPADAVLVVPYLRASEIPTIAQAGVQGLIAETGGKLSNGAITAREYGIPTVVLPPWRDRLQPRQRVHLDGSTGTVHPLSDSTP